MKKLYTAFFGIFFTLQFFGMNISMAGISFASAGSFAPIPQEEEVPSCHESLLTKNFHNENIPQGKMKCCDLDMLTTSGGEFVFSQKKTDIPHKYWEIFFPKISQKEFQKKDQVFVFQHEKNTIPSFLVHKKTIVLRI